MLRYAPGWDAIRMMMMRPVFFFILKSGKKIKRWGQSSGKLFFLRERVVGGPLALQEEEKEEMELSQLGIGPSGQQLFRQKNAMH